MTRAPQIETERLVLRRWREDDAEPYVAMMLDTDVSRWLGGPFDEAEALARIARNEAALEAHGFGRMAMERRSDGAFLGYCGLMPIAETLPFDGGFEVGWSLAQGGWGQGYASEAARAVFADGFSRLGLPQILAFTGVLNHRSQAVARRLGMSRDPDQDFDHPGLADDHPLKRHIVFVARSPQ
ncbi:GNAT family N-acetyltransferase [Phenylobacterium sp.]|uniref:GNAT family N-acetyltransferase n=1 Tax=Phenylobacterium sp. TaxID=1871053 RepID=UPI002DE6ACC8|nr:GNAT family N-acetyltransferase [Phenylobacterium sp.]